MVRGIGNNPVNFNRILKNAQIRTASTFGAQTTKTSKELKEKKLHEEVNLPRDQYTIQEQYQDAMENAQHTGAVAEKLNKREVEDETGDYARHAFYPGEAETATPTSSATLRQESQYEPEEVIDKITPQIDRTIERIDAEIPKEIRDMAEQMVLEKVDSPKGLEELETMTHKPEVLEKVATIESDIVESKEPARQEIVERKLLADMNNQPMPTLIEEQEANLEEMFREMAEQQVDFKLSDSMRTTSTLNTETGNTSSTKSTEHPTQEAVYVNSDMLWLSETEEGDTEMSEPDYKLKGSTGSAEVEQ